MQTLLKTLGYFFSVVISSQIYAQVKIVNLPISIWNVTNRTDLSIATVSRSDNMTWLTPPNSPITHTGNFSTYANLSYTVESGGTQSPGNIGLKITDTSDNSKSCIVTINGSPPGTFTFSLTQNNLACSYEVRSGGELSITIK